MLEFLGGWVLKIPGGMVALEAMPYVSLVLILYSLWVFIHHYQIFNRPKVEGVVKKSELISEFNGGMNKSSMFRYFADLEFEFVYNKQTYTGKKTSSLEFNSAVDPLAGDKINRYPLGKKVKVYIDPKSPEKSIVENMFPYSIYVIGLISVLIYMLHDALLYVIYHHLM